MKSGFAPTTTMSSTTMPTRSRPMVSCLSMRLRDRDLRADAVGAGREQRAAVARERGGVEEAGEAADAAEHLGAVGSATDALHQFDGEVACRGVDPGFGVRRALFSHACSLVSARPNETCTGAGIRTLAPAP